MPIPLTLYIHIPWCVQKCPYCDFNSHALRTTPHIPENAYIEQLLADLDNDIRRFFPPAAAQRPLTAIFIGGGTPSLFSGAAIERLLHGVRERLPVLPDAEITLEANPGAIDAEHYTRYYRAGINRISIGVQSFHAEQLNRLERIHTPEEAHRALDIAKQAGFDNINIDLMFGLPQQTAAEALADIRQGIALNTEHLSYYQLTIEP
ncbi:MAG: YggW family oxidoreductase, partial [Gammaproteobacteria bacterium]